MAYQSAVRGFGINGKSLYSNIAKPCEINLQFTVNHADTGGLGITSLKSNGYVNNVFMNTNQTPGANNGFTNPNPAAGFLAIQLQQNLNVFVNAMYSITSANSGSDVKIDNSAMTAGQVYTITTLGNATAAKWLAIGVPAGVTPAVGVSFIAASNGGAGNTLTSRVQVPSVSAIMDLESVGNPNKMVNTNIAANAGQWLFFQFLGPTISTGAYVAPMLPTAPADGSIVQMKLVFDGSAVSVDGL